MMNLGEWRGKNNILGWLLGIISTLIYFFSMDATVSWWDCGEFLSCAYKLQVGHPPGAPFYLLVARLFGMVFPVEYAAWGINALSALASGATVMFLFWSITRIARKLMGANKYENVLLVAGAVGALSFAFTDTFWFSAVEAEVYALSTLFTAIVFWCILKWNDEEFPEKQYRWLILLAYLMGLSIGVHLLNLLAIPAIVLLIHFKKNNLSKKGVLLALFQGSLLLLFVMYGVIQGLPALTFNAELFVVNHLMLPIHSGELLVLTILFAAVSALIYWSRRRRKVKYELGAVMFGVLVLGYLSYATIVIRSLANPPIDENNPEQVANFKSYINREQYGDRPLLWGQYYSAPVVATIKDKPVYYIEDGIYKPLGSSFGGYIYDEAYETFFPRMYSSRGSHPQGYRQWSRYQPVSSENVDRPDWGNNLRFFVDYQLVHMYFRYFMWNFSGRQNDKQGHGGVLNGNWITGIDWLDSMRLGDQANKPHRLKDSMARNRYFLLPFLLGILGIAWLFSKGVEGKKWFWVLLVLFFFTGVAIVLYLNQKPFEPRERDYAYVGSFYTFSVLIGLGVLQLFELLKTKLTYKAAFGTATLLGIGIPTLLLAQNWDDHNRAGKSAARDLAYNQLISCEPNAILFTYGDNDTFPLWYLQDVEGVRTDVRICNVSLLGGDWYINQMRQKYYESNPIKIAVDKSKYRAGTRDICLVNEAKDTIDLKNALDFVWNDSDQTKAKVNSTRSYNLLPYPNLKWKNVVFSTSNRYITKSDLLMLQIINGNANDRPIYFNGSVLKTALFNFDDYVECRGMVYKLISKGHLAEYNIPGDVNALDLYNRVMNEYQWGGWQKEGMIWDTHNRTQISVFDIRLMLARLALELVEINETEKAKSILLLEEKLFPNEKLPYNSHSLAVAKAWAKVGDKEKSKVILEQIGNERIDELAYYFSLKPEFGVSVWASQEKAVEDVKSVMTVALRLDLKDLYLKINQQMDILLKDIKNPGY
ncbi:DUF2723 domain-containing protein [Prolixibacteraceae bacterium JC049]|nr:DUF2723 domain-containing protein [Prolixibacteraceae bacterium JC049]